MSECPHDKVYFEAGLKVSSEGATTWCQICGSIKCGVTGKWLTPEVNEKLVRLQAIHADSVTAILDHYSMKLSEACGDMNQQCERSSEIFAHFTHSRGLVDDYAAYSKAFIATNYKD